MENASEVIYQVRNERQIKTFRRECTLGQCMRSERRRKRKIIPLIGAKVLKKLVIEDERKNVTQS